MHINKIAQMKVTLKADILPLNEQFIPCNEVSNNHTSHDIDFPEDANDSVKKDFVKQILSKHFTYLVDP